MSTASTGLSPAAGLRPACNAEVRLRLVKLAKRLHEPREMSPWPRARRVQAQARPEADARAVHVEARGARRRRSSSSSATTRGGSTTTSGSSGTARSRPGRCRRACRSSPASGPSPCTSRITRSTTRPSRARSRRATTAPARSRSGTAARTSSSRRSADGGLTVRLHGKRLEGTWTLVPAHLDGNEKNWLLIRKRDETTAARVPRSDYKPMLATLAAELPTRRRLGVRGEVGRLSRARLRPRRRGAARLAQRQRPDGALPRRREGAREGGALAGLRRRRRGVRARRAAAGRASRRCSRASRARRSSTRSSTCSRSTASPRRRPAARRSGASGSKRCSTQRQKTVQVSGALRRRARRSTTPRSSRASRA